MLVEGRYAADCLGRYAGAIAGKSQSFFRRCFDIDPIGLNPQYGSDIFTHRVDIVTHSRTLRNDRRINIFNHVIILF